MRPFSASTALEFVQALRIATDIARMTTIVSIYQAGESLYELFDKVCVVYEGRMAYFGPANKARQYFIDLGYEPANRQTTADFLVAGKPYATYSHRLQPLNGRMQSLTRMAVFPAWECPSGHERRTNLPRRSCRLRLPKRTDATCYGTSPSSLAARRASLNTV